MEGSAVARRFLDLIRQLRSFTGTYTHLLDLLNATGGSPKPPGWPKTPRALSGQIRRLTPGLRRLGVEIEHSLVGQRKTRTVTVTYRPPAPRDQPSAPSATGAGPVVPRV